MMEEAITPSRLNSEASVHSLHRRPVRMKTEPIIKAPFIFLELLFKSSICALTGYNIPWHMLILKS